MKTRRSWIVSGVASLAACLAFSALAQGAPAGAEAPEWGRAEREVAARLMGQKGDFAALVAQVTKAEPASPQEVMFKLSVMMRAGMEKEAAACVKQLKARCPELDPSQISAIYYAACDDYEAWGAARALVEAYAGSIDDLAIDNRLLSSLLRSGWTAEKVDQWLAGLVPAPPPGSTAGAQRSDRWYVGRRISPGEFWFRVRLHFDLDHGLGEARLQELAAGARARPDDVRRVMDLLQALQYARMGTKTERDLAWLPGAVKPALATQAYDLADALGVLERWDLALIFAEQAATTPLSAEEVGWMGEMIPVMRTGESLRAAFSAQAADKVAECLLKLDRKAEAQQWMVRADDIRKKHDLSRNALFAGMIQAESGQRVIEGRIQKAAEKSKDDPDYWLERAAYYQGRREAAQEEEALKQALALAGPQPTPERPVHWSDRRSQVVSRYVSFLVREKRRPEAIAMLRGEVERNPDAASAERAVHALAFDFEKEIGAEDPLLWGWLERRPKWDFTEERLVWRLLENAGPSRLEPCMARAERLAAGADPSRALRVGWVMTRLSPSFDERAIPLLKYALQHAEADADLKRTATLTLFEAYVQSGDWRRAEALYPEAAKHLGPDEAAKWYSGVAVAAAKAGAKTDAMRLWASLANLDPSELGNLDALARAGLRDDLVAFYKAMQKRLPASDVPARALKELNRRP